MVEPGVVEETDEATYFRIIYSMPKRTLLVVPNWEEAVMDECVQRALKRDFSPIGAVFVSDPVDVAPDTGEVQIKLEEGSRIDPVAFMEGFGMPRTVSVDMCSVTAEVAIGTIGQASNGL